MPVILKRPSALNDLLEIWEHIAEDSVERADAFIGIVDQKFHTLAERPGTGRIRDELGEGQF